jgi:aspartate beta-hydroxylase
MLALAGLFGDDSATARSTALKGRELLQGWGVPWHKHLSLGRWLALADLIAAEAPINQMKLILQEMRVAHGQAQAALAEEPEDILGDSSIRLTARPGASRFLSYLERVHTQRSERSIRWYPGLSRKAWHDPDRFDVARELALRFADIKAEVQNIPSSYYYEEAEEIGRTGSWKVCMFYEQGRRNRAVSEICPTITAILDRHSSVQRTSGLVYLSKMAPHTHVAAHHARSNIRLRCHLALNVPEGDCAIRVGDEVRCWDEGQCIVFDDSFEHEVWNRTSCERLVLLVDLWHPDLTTVERDAMDTVNLLGAFKATSMLQNWRRNDLQRTREANPAVK